MEVKVNCLKIVANTGFAFFSTLGSILTLNSLTSGKIPTNVIIPASLLCAAIQGGTAFFKELLEQSKAKKSASTKGRRAGKKNSKLVKALDYLTVF